MSTEIEPNLCAFNSLDSKGVFAKRRRNLIIISIVIILLALLKPDLEYFKLFGVKFEFIGKSFLLWVALAIWFFYAIMRTNAYYKTYLSNASIYFKEYVYWNIRVRNRWITLAKKAEKNSWNELIVERKEEGLYLSLQEGYQTLIQNQVKSGSIPGDAILDFDIYVLGKDGERIYEDTISKKVEFNTNPHIDEYIKQRKSQYRTMDNWWEYNFLVIITCFGILFWIIGMLRSVWPFLNY